MVDKWREVKLGEIAEIYDGPHATPKKTDSGPIFLGISNLSRGLLDLSNTEHISENDFHRWTHRVEPEEGDVVFSYETRLGEAARISHGLRCCLGRRMGLLRARVDLVDPRFLLYAYLGPDFQDTLYSRTVHGSTVDRIPLINMPHFPIVIPGNIQEQRRIAHILGTLDDKIENNRKTAKTLEAMAQAIFKSWFVDFDPVRAKMAGESRESICKRLKLTPEILDLFPDRLVDSELGEIPEGWGVGVFGNLVDYLHDQENPFSYPEVTFHHFSIPAFDEGKVPKVELGNAIKSLKLLVPPNVVLLSKLNPETNRVWLVDVAKGNRAVCSTEFLVLRAKPPFTRSYIYLFAHSDFFREKIEGLVTGTSKSHQRAQAGSVSSIPAMLPAANVIDVFNSITDKMLLRTLIYRRELTDLIKIRDTLLPKLISGEIRVPEADHLIEQAT